MVSCAIGVSMTSMSRERKHEDGTDIEPSLSPYEQYLSLSLFLLPFLVLSFFLFFFLSCARVFELFSVKSPECHVETHGIGS